MLEIPESYNIAKQLNENINGKKISNVTANKSPHKLAWLTGDTQVYNNLLANKIITECKNQSGMVEIQAEDAAVVFSDGVNIRYFKKGDKLPEKHQLHIEFNDGSSIACSVQMYGGLSAFKIGEFDNEYYLAAISHPSPLSDEFDFVYFKNLITVKMEKLSTKAFLATEQRIPGLGNGVLQDILFNAEINPRTKITSLSEAEIKTLYNSVKDTLISMAQNGGRDTEKDIFGNDGGYSTILSKNTYKNLCPRCGGEIVKKAYMGGSVYYCPTCQQEK